MGKLNKRHYSKLDWLAYVLIVAFVATVVSSIALGMVKENYIFFLIYMLLLFFVAYSWFKTYYIVGNKTITIVDGKKSIEIFYREVTSLAITKRLRKEIHGFSADCIEIKYGKHGREVTYISPFRLKVFLELLKEKCKNLKEVN